MLKSERMSAVTLLCRNEDAKAVIQLLAELKAVHVTDHQKENVGKATIDIGKPQAEAEELSAALVAIRNLLSKIPKSKTASGETPTLQHRIERIREIATTYADHEEQLGNLDHAITALEQQLSILALLPDDTRLDALKSRSVETYLLKKTAKSKKEKIDALSPVLVKESEHSVFIAVKKGAAVKESIEGYEIIDLAPVQSLKGTATDVAKELARQHASLVHQREEQQAAEKSFAQHYEFLKESDPVISLELLKAQAPLHFGSTKHLTLIRGFIPDKRTQELGHALETRGVQALVGLDRTEEAPVLLSNPKPAKDFEFLINLYTLPKYNELDPTSLMAFTFPAFFGFMLGDIGYGICALIAFIALRFSMPQTKQLANIFILSAVSSIIFGIVFGEFFGAEQIFGHHLHPLIHRTESLPLMFGIAIGIGLIHLNLGLILGMINESHEGWFFAMIKKGSWMLLQIAAFLLAAGYGLIPGFSITPMFGWLAVIIAIAGVWYGEKAKGLLELPMIFSNTLSYTRLVAIGLASVYLAFVINQIAGDLFAKGGLWLIIGIIVLIVGHAINLVLGLMGPFLHSLRLHYVEFFTKFYEGGGRPYRPFGTIE